MSDQIPSLPIIKQLSEIESLLSSIWSRVLQTDVIDVNDRFLWLGGSSLKAIQIVSEIKKKIGIEIPVTILFEHDTIKKLVGYLKKNKVKEMQFAEAVKKPDQSRFPLSELQKNFYFINQIQESHAFVYNVPLVLEIDGPLDYRVLSRSIDYLIERHEVLRTVFHNDSNEIVQTIKKYCGKKVDLFPEMVDQKEINEKIKEEINQYIPLDKPLLIKVRLFKLSDKKHVLVIVQPHIITDGWSLKILKEEMFTCYAAFLKEESPKLEPIKRAYSQYISKIKKESDIDYWLSKLKGVQNINFPCDYQRLEKVNFSGKKHSFSIEESLYKAANRFAAKHNVTPFMLFATILNILLSQFSAKEEIVIGFPISGRNESSLEKIVGLFVNTLILKSRVSLDKNFIEILREIRENCLEAYAHQNITMSELVSRMKVRRNLGVHPIFQVMLVWQDWHEEKIYPAGDMSVKSKFIDQQTSKFDLTFELLPTASDLRCFIEYNTNLFHSKTIETIATHFDSLLKQCLSFCDIPIGHISFQYPDRVRAEIPQKILPQAPSVELPIQAFEKQAEKFPSKIALTYKDNCLTYAELNKSANQLARYIRSKYIQSFSENDTEKPVIGIFLDKGLDVIISILAILKAGLAYVPIDTRSPEKRIKFIISDARCILILTKSAYKESLKMSNQSLIFLDQAQAEISKNSGDNLLLASSANDLMYIIYTSGTTGQPKGVMQTHYNVTRLFHATSKIFKFTASDTWVFFHSHAFDFSVWEMWGALFYGGHLVIPATIDVTDPHRLYQLIKKNNVTVLNQTPSAFQGFSHACQTHDSGELSLRYVIFGGESLDMSMLSDWWVKHGDVRPQMINMYGITEITVHATYKILSKKDLCRREKSNIGVPLEDMSAFVVDKNMRPVPAGVPGELLIGGNGLARGYLNQPEMTGEKFIFYPLENEESKQRSREARFYRTGDLVRYLSDGSLEYLGRIDRQIKFKGFRIETEEIESALRCFHKIAGCAVSLKTYCGTQKLVAFYTLKGGEGETPGPQEFRSFLSQHLPDYMLPNLFLRLDEIPLTNNMKTDYDKLPEIENNSVLVNAEYKSPETVPQKELAVIFEEILHVANVGIDDNFFGIGGDSITSLKVVVNARKIGFNISVSDVFKYQTVREISKHCWGEEKAQLPSDELSAFCMLTSEDKLLLPSDSLDAYPISSLQLGMIYHTLYSRNSAVYHDIFTYKIDAIYQHDCFCRALQQIINAHPVLRTTFYMENYSTPMQVVHRCLSPVIDVQNLLDFGHKEQEDKLEEWVENEKKNPFDFKNGPLYRITIHKLSDAVFSIGFSFHHAILDGWSVATFITRLLSIYDDLLKGKDNVLAVNKHYREFIYLENTSTSSNLYRNFWKEYLNGFETTSIQKWGCDQTGKKEGFHTQVTVFDQAMTKEVVALSKQVKVSVDVILLAALIKILSFLTSSEEILTGVVFNGRPSIDGIEETLGLFLNSLPFRQKVTQGSWKELILSVSSNKSKIYPYRRYPLMQIQKEVDSAQLFDVLFYFTNFHVYKNMENIDQVKIIDQNIYERTNFPLTFNFSLQDDLKLYINYEEKNYSYKKILEIRRYFSTVLSSLLSDIESDHQKCDVLSPSDKKQIITDWNNTSVPYSFNKSMHQLVESQAKITPSQIALKCNGVDLTYGDLNKRANLLAAYLKQKGVCAGDFIVVYMQRGMDFIVAVLAIFKLGGVYVPIDTMQPMERVEYILNEVNCKFILSDSSTREILPEGFKFLDKIISVDYFFKNDKEAKDIDFISYRPQERELAYVIYTSGSTGNPKGVMICHASLINFLFFMKEKLNMQGEDCFLALTSFSFDISLLEILLPLITGATCILSGEGQNRDPNWITRTIQQHAVTCLQATPTTWNMLFNFGYELSPSIKVISGGEPLTKTVANYLSKNYFAWNMYGPTETTVWSTYSPIQFEKEAPSSLPIGRPIANTKVYVLDHDLKPVPIGVPGELYIAGIGVAKGYLQQEQLTRERFLDNPFETSDKFYSKMYKTGDLVKWLSNGALCFLGRTDHQFKLRGFRIEAGDIQSAFLQHPSVKECVILVKPINKIDHLFAYLVLNNLTTAPSEKEYRAFLLKKLPYYMLPDKFVFLDSMPTNINGKIDLKALFSLRVGEKKVLLKEGCVLSEEQQLVADVWRKILNVEFISSEDNFYELGGNSISSLMAIQMMNSKFSINLTIRDLVENPILSDITRLINSYKSSQSECDMISKPFTYIKKIPDPVVALKKQGKKNPLFLIHPVGGTIFYYIPLVNRLLSNRPVYAIQDPGIEKKDRIFSSLTEMVEFYISVIRRYQPEGPYFIAGSSFGANAAVEMAQQLKEQNEVVAFTGLIDGWAKYPDQANTDKEWFANNLRSQLQAMNGLLPGVPLSDLFLDIHWSRQQLLVQHEIPKNLSLNLTLFKAQETMDVLKPLESPYNNWDQYCSAPPKTHVVPGDHFTMHFEPHIDTLAHVFNTCLEDADS